MNHPYTLNRDSVFSAKEAKDLVNLYIKDEFELILTRIFKKARKGKRQISVNVFDKNTVGKLKAEGYFISSFSEQQKYSNITISW